MRWRARRLLAWARLEGLTWSQLGLGRDRLGAGCRWALGAIGVVAGVYVVGVLLPLTRPAFQDVRYDLPLADALHKAFVVIPLGTVAARGARLPLGPLGRARRGTCGSGRCWSTTSVLFGFWHVIPALRVGRDQPRGVRGGRRRGQRRRRRGHRRAHDARRAGLRRAAPAQRQRARQRRRALGDQRPRRAVRAGGLAAGSRSGDRDPSSRADDDRALRAGRDARPIPATRSRRAEEARGVRDRHCGRRRGRRRRPTARPRRGGSFIDPLVVRLHAEYGVDPQAIRSLAVEVLATFAGARVQAFVPILVEKRLRRDLPPAERPVGSR